MGLNTELLAFYEDRGQDNKGRTLKSILGWTDDQWERSHDMIQFVFPLPEKSAHNRNAPLLNDETLAAFLASHVVGANATLALRRAEAFLGNYRIDDRPYWLHRGNHNQLRISRILRFLTLMQRPDDAKRLYDWVTQLAAKYPLSATDHTLGFWTNALKA